MVRMERAASFQSRIWVYKSIGELSESHKTATSVMARKGYDIAWKYNSVIVCLLLLVNIVLCECSCSYIATYV